MTKAQQEIISSNKFDLTDTKINPKTSPSSSFAGITDSITQISLGNAKIRGENEVFLSGVDPSNIPADLDIRFDSEKEIRIIGAEVTKNNQKNDENSQNDSRKMMSIEAETI